jgi:hypothetical protein
MSETIGVVRGLISSSLIRGAISLIAFSSVGAKTRTLEIRWDPDEPNEKSAVIWLGYLGARLAYHEKHKSPIPPSGEIVPSFDEELDARTTATQIYRELKEKDAKLKDPYWETLSDVDRRGLMGPYVWIFLRRPQWPSSAQPSNLAAFEAWKKQALPRHQAQTYGRLEAGDP